MSMHYVTESDAIDTYTLPTIWVEEFTALEVAETMEEEIWQFGKRPEFRLASMNGRVRDAMLQAMIKELDIIGGYMFCSCLPGCLPDSTWEGPFPTRDEAVATARNLYSDE